MGLLLANAAITWALVGLIWTIQCVHYPQFRYLDAAQFIEAHAAHVRGITPLVAPLMLAELGASAALIALRPAALPSWVPVVALVMVIGAWISTAALSVPLHNRLESGPDPAVLRALVRTNWPRTVLWTARAALLSWAVVTLMAARSG